MATCCMPLSAAVLSVTPTHLPAFSPPLPFPRTHAQGGYLTYRAWMMRTRWSWHVKERLRAGKAQYQAVLDALNVLGTTPWWAHGANWAGHRHVRRALHARCLLPSQLHTSELLARCAAPAQEHAEVGSRILPPCAAAPCPPPQAHQPRGV